MEGLCDVSGNCLDANDARCYLEMLLADMSAAEVDRIIQYARALIVQHTQ